MGKQRPKVGSPDERRASGRKFDERRADVRRPDERGAGGEWQWAGERGGANFNS